VAGPWLGAVDSESGSRTLKREVIGLSRLPNDLPIFRAPEYDAVRAALGDCRGLRVLDAGCGDCELSEVANDAALVFAMDLKPPLPTVRRGNGVTRVVCGDVTNMPFPENSFDVAICTSVISHLHSVGQRAALLGELSRVLRPEGKLIITTMHFNFRFQNKGTPKEGHEHGIFYRKYYPDEFRSELGAYFEVASLWGLWNYLPKTYRVYVALGKHVLPWERFFRTKKSSLKYGKFLLAICSNRF